MRWCWEGGRMWAGIGRRLGKRFWLSRCRLKFKRCPVGGLLRRRIWLIGWFRGKRKIGLGIMGRRKSKGIHDLMGFLGRRWLWSSFGRHLYRGKLRILIRGWRRIGMMRLMCRLFRGSLCRICLMVITLTLSRWIRRSLRIKVCQLNNDLFFNVFCGVVCGGWWLKF